VRRWLNAWTLLAVAAALLACADTIWPNPL
jgi:hypothetical protein